MNIRLITVLFVLFIGACSDSGSSSSGVSADKENLILALGDSIGAGDHTGGYAYPEITAILTGIPVINASIPGSNAETAVSHAQGLIEEHNPQYLIALLGTNNALGAPGGVQGAINILQTLANICADYEVICIISTLPPIPASNSANADAAAINAGIYSIEGIRIADSAAVMTGSDIGSDGIHPHGGGQDKIGATFAAQITD